MRSRRQRVRFGSLRRVTPISRGWGYDRGTPIDRCYIERFLDEHRADVRGRVLEIGDRTYTQRFGGSRVTTTDVLHGIAGNVGATIVGDLNVARQPTVPSEAFDCIILTQTLQLLYELRNAISNLHRTLKPGGVLLATMPGICATQPGADNWPDEWCWSFTTVSVRRLMSEHFGAANVEVESHGNVLAATAFLYGLACEDLKDAELATRDLAYPLVVTARAIKF